MAWCRSRDMPSVALMIRIVLLCLASILPPAASAQTTCGGAEAPCEIADGSYHVREPEGWTGTNAVPVLIFFHGHRGTGRPILGNGGMATDFADQGYLLVAPNGFAPEPGGPRSYPARDRDDWRDDIAFTFAVLDDLESRYPIDRERIYAAGFSAGGSMVWRLACAAGDRLAGMVSVAGALRVPNDTTCDGLAGLPILQVHGFTDNQVPFEGRAIRDWHQGSVWDSLELAVARNGCRTHPDTITLDDPFWTRDWHDSCSGAPVRLVIHPGGHGLPQGWTGLARQFFEAQLTQ